MPSDSIDEIIKKREQRLVSKDNPGTIVQMEELEKLVRFVNQDAILVVEFYELDYDDYLNLTTKERKILLEGVLGYERDKDYVVTHLIGSEEDIFKHIFGKDEKVWYDKLYAMTAMDDLIKKIKSGNGEVLFENAHDSFFYHGCGQLDHPMLKLGPNFHSNWITVETKQKIPEKENYFLSEEAYSSFLTRDLEGHKIIRLDTLVKNKKEDAVDQYLKEH